MNSIALSQSIRILCIPPYYEDHFELAVNRLTTDDQHSEHDIFTIDKKLFTTGRSDLHALLSMCRKIISQERIQMLFADSHLNQLLVAKLGEEYPKFRNHGMNFLSTLQCINRYLMTHVFKADECIPTLLVHMTENGQTSSQNIQTLLSVHRTDGFVKSAYRFDTQLSSFRFTDWNNYVKTLENYMKLYRQQYRTSLLPFFQVYVSEKQYPSLFQASHLVQPFLDLATYPHWRLVIASACVFDSEIIMWPLVDGYSGWPFLAENPLAIMPILVCPSRQISMEQQNLVYTRFRQHLTHLITHQHLRFGWIECSYFLSCTNEVRLISIQPMCSVYLSEAFRSTCHHGNPMTALVQLSIRQRPATPIQNNSTVYIHRLWTNVRERSSVDDLISTKKMDRTDRYVRLRFQKDDIIDLQDNELMCIEMGFIQVSGEYYQNGLANLVEFRDILLKKPELFPFAHSSMLSSKPYQFDPITCLPSTELLEQLEELRKQKHKDLI